MYVYIQSEPGLYTVGFYAPDGRWHPESDHNNREGAAGRVSHLNGVKNNNYEPVLKSDVLPEIITLLKDLSKYGYNLAIDKEHLEYLIEKASK